MSVYFDNNASTVVAPEVVAKMVPLLTDHFGNPSSVHRIGQRAAEELADARAKVAALLGAKAPSEIVFTGSGTEADNLAIVGALNANPDKKHIITTAVEHPAVLKLCQEMASAGECELTCLPVDADGQIALDDLRTALRPDTAVVSIMMVNNETGVVFDVVAAGEIVRQHGALFHVDGVQAAGKIALDLAQWPIDLFTISGHKLHASKGVGALYVRRGVSITAMIQGGRQERGRRAGTENVPAIAGLGVACELAQESLTGSIPEIGHLRDHLEKSILAAIPDSAVNGSRSSRVATTSNLV
ncbi:MAG: cysteine desulfurase, partial [Candidatus Krumholzibacteriia bacterium]